MNALIAAAIHDAKNGLHALNACLIDAQNQAPSPALGEARIIADQISAQLVELLAVYRASEGNLRLAVDDHDLREFFEEIQLEPLLPLALRNTVSLTYELTAIDEIGTWAFDAYQVKLVLLDALRNAVRHAKTQVRCGIARATGGGLDFSVVDDGPGFPPEVLGGEDTSMSADSSGLGLLFARLIAARHATPQGHHGTVTLDNQGINGGARLTLHLP